MSDNLKRLLSPKSFVVLGGRAAEVAIEQSKTIGYQGQIWAVHPYKDALAGVPCHRRLSNIPEIPDAAFVAVSREATVGIVADLAALGVGGVVCHASGFAEDSEYGAGLERQLVAAAANMTLVGPNCLGLINYLDGAALWSDQQGGTRVERGVALIAQSGNIAQNLTMQRRSLPIAQVVTVGNSAVTGVLELIEGMLDDTRITAIGLYLEAMPDVSELSRVALEAQRRRMPIVAMKAGTSDLGERTTLSHTSSLAGPDSLVQALFDRLGIARVHRIETFVETLKLLHVHGAIPGTRITTASCSGGEAAHLADLAASCGITLPPFSAAVEKRLRLVLGDRVAVGNPLDYHTYIWDDKEALRSCFSALLSAGFDEHLLMLDVPRADRSNTAEFDSVLEAFIEAQSSSDVRSCVVSSLPEGLPEHVGGRLLAAGIAPMQGIADCLQAIKVAAQIGAAQAEAPSFTPFLIESIAPSTETSQLDEPTAKQSLARFGVPVPRGRPVDASDALAVAVELGFPVVLKTVSSTLMHKSDAGGVHINLRSRQEVTEAVGSLRALGNEILVEEMVHGALVELIIGVGNDPQFGLAVTVGTGGVFAELVDDVATILLPASRTEIRDHLQSLRCWRLLTGFRGHFADVECVLDAVEAIAAYAAHHAGTLVELEINPLLVLTDRVVAVDAVARFVQPNSADHIRGDKVGQT